MQANPTRRVQLTRIRPKHRERRFYRLEIVTDLFGTVLLQRRWGRIGTDGQQVCELFADEMTAIAALDRQAARKRRRGYQETPLNAASIIGITAAKGSCCLPCPSRASRPTGQRTAFPRPSIMGRQGDS
jgi:predicted DNA-binding WGR domain protein